MTNLEFTSTDGSIQFDPITTDELECHENNRVINSAEILQSVVNLIEIMAEATKPVYQLIEVVADNFGEFIVNFLETLNSILKEFRSLETVNFEWNLYFPSFSTDSFDISVPHTGPPAISDDLRDEKEFYGKIALAIFAYSLVITIVCVGFVYPTEIAEISSAIISSNPILFGFGSRVILFILEKKLKKYKDKIISIFWPF